MRISAGFVLLVVIGQSPSTLAEGLITFRFHGVVNQVLIDEGPAPPGIGPGSSFDGTYSFNPAAVDTANYDYHGVYHTEAPNAVTASIGDLHWHADRGFVAIIDGPPQQTDIYEAGESRLSLDSHPELAEELDIWIFQLSLRGPGTNLSNAGLLLTPPDLTAWSETKLLMIGDSSRGPLDPVPAVMINATLTDLELAGDFQGDGDVDVDDLGNWLSNFGSAGASHRQGDADGDAVVDGADFLAWQRQLSKAQAEPTPVPEPGACMLACVMAGSLLCRCRCRKQKR
jgi:hypothetical protein